LRKGERGIFTSKDIEAMMLEIKVSKLGPGDAAAFMDILRVFEDAFEEPYPNLPGKEYLTQLLARDDFFVFVAVVDGKVVGGLTSYLLRSYTSAVPMVYIYDLGVEAASQRMGVGRRLVEAHNVYCKSIGVETVWVQAHATDDHAVAFYRALGVEGEDVVHFELGME
jgi:aminoglycoside 3-N-acetyltransferase I